MSVMPRLIVLAMLCVGVLGAVACGDRGVEEAPASEPVVVAPVQEVEPVVVEPPVQEAVACPTNEEIEWVLASAPIYTTLGEALTLVHETVGEADDQPTLRHSKEWKAKMLVGSFALLLLAEDLLEIPLNPIQLPTESEETDSSNTQTHQVRAIPSAMLDVMGEAIETADRATYIEGPVISDHCA